MMRNWMTAACVVAFLVTAQSRAWAWHDEGHFYSTRAAVGILPARMPAFFRHGRLTIDHCAIEPDAIKNRALPFLNSAEQPEHYIDLELLKGHPLPNTRYAYIALCQKLGVEPNQIGMLPYSIMQWQQRLTVLFAEYRRNPNDKPVQYECLVTAGILSHYTADLEQPLHTTIDFNGRAYADGRSPHSGIHPKVDALPTHLPYSAIFKTPVAKPESHPKDVFGYMKTELAASHAKVDQVYAMEKQLPAMDDFTSPLPRQVKAFTIERMHAAAHFTASLWLSAWDASANIQTPKWLHWRMYDQDFDPNAVLPVKWAKEHGNQ